MTFTIPLVWDALYDNIHTGERYKFLGIKSKVVVLQNPDNETVFEIPKQEFNDNYKDTGIHDHVASCCDVHETHTSPHTGCLLR